MSAILFGSISTVADTSELQREAFNKAFETHGLQWQWGREEYRAMLDTSGGQSRIAQYARSLDQSVDAKAVHETKSKLFQESLASAELSPRDGVVDTIKGAKSNGWKVALVTTTSSDNISALLDALSPAVQSADFDVIVDSSSVEKPKPDEAAYSFALQSIGEEAVNCVAIEDNVDGVQAAVAAGLACVAFPNENTAGNDFTAAQRQVQRLELEQLQQLTLAK
jgi:HAD superfamily hydrolase (TIGR01509 family)